VLVPVDDYREGILAGIEPLAPIALPLADSHGCVLAEDVVAPWPLPSFDNSSMDGYAVLVSDIAGASEESPVTLTVIDDVPAGFRADVPVTAGNAVRIMTGAPMPPGAECVVPVEKTDGGTEGRRDPRICRSRRLHPTCGRGRDRRRHRREGRHAAVCSPSWPSSPQ
jgi:molybdopterin molybdotransferase